MVEIGSRTFWLMMILTFLLGVSVSLNFIEPMVKLIFIDKELVDSSVMDVDSTFVEKKLLNFR
jgi:hypothetical protein